MSYASAVNDKSFILKRRTEFERTFKVGRRFSANTWLAARFCDNGADNIRVGWTIPSHVGPAVLRNKFKRWIRDSVRKSPSRKKKIGKDINILFKKQPPGFYKQLKRKEMDEALEKIFIAIVK